MKQRTFNLKRLLIAVTTVTTLFINFLAVYLPLNGKTTQELSDKYNVFFSPMGYVFSIWFVIYLGLLAYVVFMLKRWDSERKLIDNIFPFHVTGLLANSAWIFLWHYEYIGLSVLIMIVLLVSLIKIYTLIQDRADENRHDFVFNWFLKIPFSVYLGWISVATIANISVFLYSQGVSSIILSGSLLAGLLIIVASKMGGLAVVKNADYAFPLVILWSIVGIVGKFPNNVEIAVSVLFGVIILLGSMLYRVYKDKA